MPEVDAAAVALMAEPLNASISTSDASGGPRVVPIWFRYDDGKILIWTKDDRAWLRHLSAIRAVRSPSTTRA